MFKRILVPVDGSPPSDEAVAVAGRLAAAEGAPVRLVHVVDQTAYMAMYGPPVAVAPGDLFQAFRDSGQRSLDQAAQHLARAGVVTERLLVDRPEARLGDAVAAAATDWGADLIVVGTHGRRGPSRLFLGSGAEQVIRLAPVPVLVIRVPDQA